MKLVVRITGYILYFSFFDFFDDKTVSKELIDFVYEDMKQKGIDYMEGPFTPFDPDARRGVLTNFYDDLPTLFTTYNYDYYPSHYESLNLFKAFDTICMSCPIDDNIITKTHKMGSFIERHIPVDYFYLDLNNIDKEINDIASIFKEATTQINYQEAPSVEMIREVFQSMKAFINTDLIVIAREKETKKPVGFIMVLLDYNLVLKHMHGKMNIFAYLLYKRKIRRTRGMLQYVIPSYQKSGIIAPLFDKVAINFHKYKINSFEGGTILEENVQSFSVFNHYNCKISKRYRIYGRSVHL